MNSDHDAYIARAPAELRSALSHLRTQLARALPDADEVIAYRMPGFRPIPDKLIRKLALASRKSLAS
jgi:uncharacterized protein YdhG (YjbR/CyaY superfamily)